MSDARIVFASHNMHKLQEVRDILSHVIADFDPEWVSSAADYDLPEPVEDGANFEENALIKAHQIVDTLGIPAFADDSGICVHVMGGAPGIFSARWAGHHGEDDANLDLLLAQLADVPKKHRRAHFACAGALVIPQELAARAHPLCPSEAPCHMCSRNEQSSVGRVNSLMCEDSCTEHVEHGAVYGTLRYERAGEGGFGYDPIFQPEGYSLTLAEIPAEEKNKISHRRAAFQALAPYIANVIRA